MNPKSRPKYRYRFNKPARDITGRRFGNLEVLRMKRKPYTSQLCHPGTWWAICKCHLCGNTNYWIVPHRLKNTKFATVHSCGCDLTKRRQEAGRKSAAFIGFKEISSHYISQPRWIAKQRQLAFDIDGQFIWDLYKAQEGLCALSGVPIKFARTNLQRTTATASLDRINSDLGYTKDNVQWVHKDIQGLKMHLPETRFIELCTKVAQHTKHNKLRKTICRSII